MAQTFVKTVLVIAVLSVAQLTFAAQAQAGETPSTLADRVREHRLENGMVILALVREGAPVVSLNMTYKAGSIDEPSGSTGMAHVLEHMLFKGTTTLGTKDWEAEKPLLHKIETAAKKIDALTLSGGSEPETLQALNDELKALQTQHRELVVPSEIDTIYSKNGGVGFNAYTTTDLTSYIVSLPSNRLELWASIESERMREPILREYYTERDVIMEERRQRVDTRPGGLVSVALAATAYRAHPYRNPVIGWAADLRTLDIDATRRFYREHYGPDNAVVVAVGNFDPDYFFGLMDRYFGGLEARGGEKRVLTGEPVQLGPRRAEIFFDAEPRLAVAYHKPALPHRDDYVLDVVDSVLSDGNSSRLVRELVERRRVATSVATVNGNPGSRYDNLFTIYLTPAQGVDPEDTLAALREELARLVTEPPSAEELEKVKTRLEAGRVRALISDGGMARTLAYFQTVADDWRYMEEHPRVLATITPAEVSEVAARYFKPANETVVLLSAEVGK